MMNKKKNLQQQHHHPHYDSEGEFWHSVEMLDPEAISVLGFSSNDLNQEKKKHHDGVPKNITVTEIQEVPATQQHQFRWPWRLFRLKRSVSR